MFSKMYMPSILIQDVGLHNTMLLDESFARFFVLALTTNKIVCCHVVVLLQLLEINCGKESRAEGWEIS